MKPYLQLGHTQAAGKVVLMWHPADSGHPLDGRDSLRRRSPLAGRRAGRRRPPPHRRPEHRAAPGLSPGPHRAWSRAKKVWLSDQPGRIRWVFEAEGHDCPVRPTRNSGSSCSATAGPTRPTEGDRLSDLCGEARLRDDHRRYRLRQGSDLRVSRQILADLQRRRRRRRRKVPPCCARPCSSPPPATTTSPPATWGSSPTGWPTSTTGTSR